MYGPGHTFVSVERSVRCGYVSGGRRRHPGCAIDHGTSHRSGGRSVHPPSGRPPAYAITAPEASASFAAAVKTERRVPSSADPVGDALAAAGQVTARLPDESLDPAELREIIAVSELEPEYGGFNTVGSFADECVSFAVMEDGIELALADEPGIDELYHPDREELLIRTTLALADVHAAAIRAVLGVNQRPRDLPPIGLPLAQLSAL